MSIPKIMVGYPHPGTVSHEFHYSLLRAHVWPGYDCYIAGLRSGVSIARARNRIVALCLNSDADYLLMCDTDGAWGPHRITQLMERDVPIVSGHAMGQEGPEGGEVFSAVLTKNGDGHLHRKAEIETGLVMVDAVGMHFTLIQRTVLETMGTRPQWPFAATLNKSEEHRTISDLGEDATFCLRAKAMGFDTYVDYDCPVGHIKERILWPPDSGEDPLGMDKTPTWTNATLN